MSKIKDWLLAQFIEWEKMQPRRQTYSAFARYLDVKQSTLSQWMAGNYDPQDEKIIAKLAAKLGEEVYDVLGLPHPKPTGLDRLPHVMRDRLARAAYQVDKYFSENSLSEDSPEAEQAAIRIFEANGFKYIDTLPED
jgi:transcriptional regulator with XRE-family HTH domain